mmetsp:Transcript_37118/g.85196  ORF Transcript_37118/g.85196 Transcript_37118/m.85196 type:complete len:108 (-) Transcript_37118:986-1309(-)
MRMLCFFKQLFLRVRVHDGMNRRKTLAARQYRFIKVHNLSGLSGECNQSRSQTREVEMICCESPTARLQLTDLLQLVRNRVATLLWNEQRSTYSRARRRRLATPKFM